MTAYPQYPPVHPPHVSKIFSSPLWPSLAPLSAGTKLYAHFCVDTAGRQGLVVRPTEKIVITIMMYK